MWGDDEKGSAKQSADSESARIPPRLAACRPFESHARQRRHHIDRSVVATMAGETKGVGIMFKQRSIAERDGLDLRAFVLAGGDGTRLQSLTHKIDGDGRPKQFSNIFGGKILLTHTIDRMRTILPTTRSRL